MPSLLGFQPNMATYYELLNPLPAVCPLVSHYCCGSSFLLSLSFKLFHLSLRYYFTMFNHYVCAPGHVRLHIHAYSARHHIRLLYHYSSMYILELGSIKQVHATVRLTEKKHACTRTLLQTHPAPAWYPHPTHRFNPNWT